MHLNFRKLPFWSRLTSIMKTADRKHDPMRVFTAAYSMFIICLLFFDCFSMNSSMSSSGSPQYNSYHDNVQNNRYYEFANKHNAVEPVFSVPFE